MSSIDNKLIKRKFTGKFDSQAMLDSSHETLMKSYENYTDQYTRKGLRYKQLKERSDKCFKYPDTQVISFRSACLARAEINCKTISVKAIGNQHGFSPQYSYLLSGNYLLRPDCLPDPELVEQFKAKYAESMAHIKVIQANKSMSEMDPAQIRILNRSKKAMQWNTLWEHFKKNFGKHPVDGIEALVMLRELLLNECINREAAELGVILIFENILLFKELLPPDKQED